MDPTWTPLRLVAWTQGYLARAGAAGPRLDAELLLAHALGCDRLRLYLDFDKPLGPAELGAYRELVRRRAEGEPVAYLTGRKEFLGHRLRCDARALVPRPETELVAEEAIAALPAEGLLLDLCTGSGCIALAASLARPRARVLAVDLSAEALSLARENAGALGARVELLRGDLFEPVDPALRFDVLVANPPYVPSAELAALPREVKREPALALDGGEGGLEVARRIVAGAPARLRPGGALVLEMHETHRQSLPRLCLEAGFASAEAREDLARLPRYLVARAREAPAP